MGDRTDKTSATKNTSPKQKTVLILAGTAVAVLTAGILFQVFNAQPADAGRDRATVETGTQKTNKKALARVNNQLIDYDRVAAECMERYGKEVLDKIIHRTLIQQACDEQGIVVTTDEVNAEIVKIAKRFDQDVENWLQLMQVEQDISPIQYQRDVIWPKLALEKLAGEQVKVTEADMRRSFIRDYGEKVKARVIVFDNQRSAAEIWEALQKDKSQKNFEKMAQEHSIDSNSRALAGVIPPIRRFSGNEQLENAAFALKEGEISGVIQLGLSSNRYVILYSEGRTEQTFDFKEVQDTVHQHVLETKVHESVVRVCAKMKEEAESINFLTNTTSGGVQTTATSTPGFARTGSSRSSNSKTKQPARTANSRQ